MGRTLRTAVLLGILLALVACSSGPGDPEPAARPTTTPAPTVTVVTLNVLHGLFCPKETDSCGAPARVEILRDLLEEAGCPDLVGLQEVGPRQEELLLPGLTDLCGGHYRLAWQGVDSPDRVLVLTTLPILDQGYLDLAEFPWEAYRVRVAADVGPVDLLTAHFASSANDPPCRPGRCPPTCQQGAPTNECHAVQVVDELDAQPPGAVLAIAGGDLNARPRSATVATFLDAGFEDAWLASGREECDPDTHLGCTAGGDQPEPFVGMDTEAGPGFDTRIDQVLVRPGPGCVPEITTEGFGVEPRSTPRRGLYWASDHAGVAATVSCP